MRVAAGRGVVRRVPGVPGGAGDAAGLRAASARLRELPAGRDERIAGQDAEIALLREHLAALQAQVADLAARAKPDSRNSGKPPSPDGPARPAPKSLRGNSGRRPGRPKGQPGAAVQLPDHPDKRGRRRPAKCRGRGKPLKGAEVTGAGRRQVTGIPPARAKTTGHQLPTLLCGRGCQAKAQAPDGVTAPVRYGPRLTGTGTCLRHGRFLSRDRACRALPELSGCAPSPGAPAAAARKTAGKLARVHPASRGKSVPVTVHAKRGKDEMTAAGVLPSFAGIAVRDAWKPCGTFDNVTGRARCGAHVLRELTAVTDAGTDPGKARAQQATDALPAPGKAAEAARQDEKDAIGPKAPAEHEDRYRKAAATGIAQRRPQRQAPAETARPGHQDAGPRGRLPAVRPRPARTVHQQRSGAGHPDEQALC